jgi:hypothetical protein
LYFFDWIKCYQDFDFELPVISDNGYFKVDLVTGEQSHLIQPTKRQEGSYCTSVSIQISGNRLTFDGNISRYNRLDNLVGYSTLDESMKAINHLFSSLGLPRFTPCTKTFHRQGKDGEKVDTFSDGCTFQRLDITSNLCTDGHSRAYIKGVSTQPYKHSIPRLHTNGYGCDWLSKKGKATLVYPKLYDKANEIRLHSETKIKNKYGKDSDEFKYIQDLIKFLDEKGVVRYEQELHSAFLRRHNLRHWGLFDETIFNTIHQEFVDIDKKLGVTSMELQTITERLVSEGACSNTRSANATAMYAILWANGQQFDFAKRQVKTHRARLRKIGIDIKSEFDASRFSVVHMVKAHEVNVTPLVLPTWYQRPQNFKLGIAA